MNIQGIFELIPVGLALVSIIYTSRAASKYRRSRDKFAAYCATLASAILIVAQSSWWTTVVVQQSSVGEFFANTLWTIFNTMVMVIFILFTSQRKYYGDNP